MNDGASTGGRNRITTHHPGAGTPTGQPAGEAQAQETGTMTAQERKERTEEMINRVYADLPADVRQQMIDAELRASTPDSGARPASNRPPPGTQERN